MATKKRTFAKKKTTKTAKTKTRSAGTKKPVRKGVAGKKTAVAKRATRAKRVKALVQATGVKSTGKQKPEKAKLLSAEEAQIERRKSLRYRVRVILIVILAVLLVLTGVMWSEIARADEYHVQQETYATEVAMGLAEYYEDYEKEVPKLEFATEGLEEIEKKNGRLRAKKYREQKQAAEERIARLRAFAEIRGQVEEFFRDGILRSDVDSGEIEEMQGEFDELKESYRGALQAKLEMIRYQYQAIVDLAAAVPGMFTDEKMETVKDDLTREQYDEIRAKVDSLPQRDIAEKYSAAMKKADEALAERERIAEEERRKAEEEYRRRQAEIAAAWRILNVPYWSQNGEGVKNGCEAAALLMALQYKGYLGGMNLRTYAEMMPKSDDPFTGFRGNIFESAGSEAPFWIAPGPLAAFGRESSGANVVDITGASLDALDAEVAAGNPVVIYLTLSYTAPSAWRYGAPVNLHVMLLTGYNSLTGMQRVTDPLTIGGKTYYDLPRAQVESILNATGNRAVVVR